MPKSSHYILELEEARQAGAREVIEEIKGARLLSYPGLSAIPPNCYYFSPEDLQVLEKRYVK